MNSPEVLIIQHKDSSSVVTVMTQLHMHRSYGTEAMIVTRSGTRSGARKWA
jgi:hypothetical protein